MATSTRSASTFASQKSKMKSSMGPKEDSHHLSALMMLGSQLLSCGRFNDGLPGFVTRGLDAEQIWQQVELRNEHKLSLTTCTRNAVRIQSTETLKKKKRNKVSAKTSIKDKGVEAENTAQDSSDGDNEDDDLLESIKKRLEDDSGDEEEDFGGLGESEDEADFDFELEKEIVKGLSDDDDEGDDVQKNNTGQSKKKQIPQRRTIVDDKFFKLADMEQFLDIEDSKEEKKMKNDKKSTQASDDDDNESDDGDIDMFGDLDSDEDDATVNAKYTDFFDPPYGDSNDKKANKKGKKEKDVSEEESGEESDAEPTILDEKDEDNAEEESGNESDEEDIEDENDIEQEEEEEAADETKGLKKKVAFSDDLLKSEDEESDTSADKKSKSTFELKQDELQKRAREMEELSLKEASWELKGEATAGKRPENSLLETVLDFQHSTRAAPVITDDTTKTLEDYIRQRIKDKTFDDVERKNKPKEDAFEFKKRVVLDQEKSKQSLGELYEQEFLKQQQQDDDEVKADPECEKIEKQLNKLLHQLDALSNFRYTPMKPGTEVKIIVNTPAIAMEEVAPVATADSELLAPEEVYDKKKGEIKGDDERTSTDKKRALRQKKADKRERKKAKEAREKLVDKMNPGLGNKYSKDKARKKLEELTKSDKNVTLIKGDRKKLGSSTAFFSQLQDEVQTNALAKKGSKEAKKRKIDPSLIML